VLYGMDLARAILAVHAKPAKAAGERWLLTDGRTYDLWDLAAAWGDSYYVQKGLTSQDAEEPRGPLASIVRELMRENNIATLPRAHSDHERMVKFDSRDFWESFDLDPVHVRLELSEKPSGVGRFWVSQFSTCLHVKADLPIEKTQGSPIHSMFVAHYHPDTDPASEHLALYVELDPTKHQGVAFDIVGDTNTYKFTRHNDVDMSKSQAHAGVRVVVGAVAATARDLSGMERVLVGLKIKLGDSNWNCVNWAQAAYEELKADGRLLLNSGPQPLDRFLEWDEIVNIIDILFRTSEETARYEAAVAARKT
jgi:hypothetical protein